MILKIFTIINCLTILNLTAANVNLNFNVTNLLKQRNKRTLTFEGGGDIRFVIGPIFDVDFDDPVKYRSMVVLYNLHGGQYTLPAEPLYPWDKYENIFARSMRKLIKHNNRNAKNFNLESAAAMQYWSDDSRLFVYSVLENFMQNRKNVNGRNCLLRSICENAQVQEHVGILSEILNIVLTPGKENIDEIYGAAYAAGSSGVDCYSLFNDCPMGENIFDTYLEYL